jgi:phosphatidylglycerophosphate synthase
MLDARTVRWRRLPWLISGLRLLLAPLYVLALEMSATLPLALAVIASLSDFVDGRLARRLGVTSPSGAVLDVVADGTFVMIALAALASAGIVSWLLPLAVLLALAGLALSATRARRAPATTSQPVARSRGPADRAGHAAGIVNYGTVLVGSGAVAGWIPAGWIAPASVAVAVLNLSPLVLRLAHGGVASRARPRR